MNEILKALFYQIGQYGPIFLVIRTLILLRDKPIYFNYYLIGSLINTFLNLILKLIIQKPRPSIDEKTFNLALKHMKTHNYLGAMSYDAFGMPSGHAQSVFYSTFFVYLVFQRENIFMVLFYLLISIITIIQRVYFKFHSVNQIVIGSFIGIIFAFIVYKIANNKIKGELKVKPDDDGPL